MIMAWCAAAAVAWGRGVPTYREYSREIEWGTESELSGEVGLDEAQRLEARAAAAREDIVGTDRPLDLFRAGSSPFSQQGVKGGGMALASDEGVDNASKRKKKDSNWLLSELKLESLTTTNQAVLDGLRGDDDEEEGAWGWLADEVQGMGEEPETAPEANEAPEGMNDMIAGMTERMAGTGMPGMAGTSVPERTAASGSTERGGGPERAADASGGTEIGRAHV